MNIDLTNLQWDVVQEALSRLAVDRYSLQGDLSAVRDKVCLIADTAAEIARQRTPNE